MGKIALDSADFEKIITENKIYVDKINFLYDIIFEIFLINIIEFKCNQDADQAIKQIKENNYNEGFTLKDKDLVLMGINFETDKKNIDGFMIE